MIPMTTSMTIMMIDQIYNYSKNYEIKECSVALS